MTNGRWTSAAKRFAPVGAATIVVGLLAALFSPAAEAARPEPADQPLAAVPASYAAVGSQLSDVLPVVAARAPVAQTVVAAMVAPVAAPVAAVVPVAVPQPGSDAAMFTSDAPDARVQSAIGFALRQLGLPYVWGGNGPAAGDSGFDCSGLTTASYAAAGIGLPRTAQTQYYAGPHVPSTAGLLPGDLVFYGVPGLVHHVGMYLGAGKMINAPTFGKPVQVAYVRYPGDDYLGATRPAYGGALVPGYLPAIPPPGSGPAPRTPSPLFEAPVAPAPTPAEIQADVAAATAPATGIDTARTAAPVDLTVLVPGTTGPDEPVTSTPAGPVLPTIPAPSAIPEPPLAPTSPPTSTTSPVPTPPPGVADPTAPTAPVVDPVPEPPVPVSPLPSDPASPAPVSPPPPVATVPSPPPAPPAPAPPAPVVPPAPVEPPAPVVPPAPAPLTSAPKPAPKPKPKPAPVVTPAPTPPPVPAKPVLTTAPPKPVTTTTTVVPTAEADAAEADG